MNTYKKPTVSVVIPAFNAAEFLAEALDSVLAQTYQPLEVIVVDDGSEDETPQVAAAYSGKVTYVRKPHGGGCGGTRNVGIRAARGEWIAFLDADDVWMPNLVEKLVKAAAETGADLVFCDYLRLINRSVVGPSNLERKGFKTRMDTLAPKGVLLNAFELLLEVGCYIGASSVLVGRDALLQIGLFDEKIYCTDDLDLWLRLSLRYRFAAVKEVLVCCRVHAGNISRDTWTLMTNQIKTYEKLERYPSGLAPGTKWRKIVRKQKAPLLREQGALYLERGEVLLARESWAKGFRSSYSPRLAAYWLATFLPQPWMEALRNWKRQVRPVRLSPGYRG